MNKLTKKELVEAAIAAVNAYWLWVGDEGDAADMMRHHVEGALVVYMQAIGRRPLIRILKDRGIRIPCEVQSTANRGFWMNRAAR